MGNAGGSHNVAEQLLPFRGDVLYQHRYQKHTLIPGLQILKQVLGFLPVGGKVRGNDVHIISGPHRLFLFLDLHFLQVAHFPLDIADRRGLVDRLDMKVDRHRVVQVQKFGQHPVRQLRR